MRMALKATLRPTIKTICVLATLGFAAWAVAQPSSPSQDGLVGCYETLALASVPPDLPTGGIPRQFELTHLESTIGRHWFQLRAPEATDAPAVAHHIWFPDRKNIKVQFGWGMGGWQGTLKPSAPHQFVGKLKPFCDFRCEGPKQVVTMRVQRVECPK